VTGISELASDAGRVIVSPNPSNGDFTIDLSDLNASVQTIAVYDNTGRQVQQAKFDKSDDHIRVNGITAAGLYFVQVVTDRGVAVKKIIVK